MSIDYDFSTVTLLTNETRLLRKIARRKTFPMNKELNTLCQNGFLVRNHSDQRDPFGVYVPDVTVSISDKTRRYFAYCRRRTLDKYLTPIVVSALTTVLLYTLQYSLLPRVLSWGLDLLRWMQTNLPRLQ